MIYIHSISDLSRLARLALSPEEEGAIAKDLEQVFQWVSQLESLQITEEEYAEEGLVLRKDIALPPADPQDIVANAPESHEGFFAVPNVLE